MDAAEEALRGRDVTVQLGDDLVEVVVDRDLLLAAGLQVFEDRGVDHGGGVVARHHEAQAGSWGFDYLSVGLNEAKIEYST